MENLASFSQDDKKRLAYIEGREDLFSTKILSITNEGETTTGKGKILIVSRDPGSANALIPVIVNLAKDPEFNIKILTDGRAQEIFQKKIDTKDVTPQAGALADNSLIGKPDVLLIDPSQSEVGIDTYAPATYPEVPMVLLEDYYGSSLKYLRILKNRNDKVFRLPAKICVMDEAAKNLIAAEMPDLEDRIEITGQPSFDRLAQENTDDISEKVRTDLGLKKEDKVVTIMSSLEGLEFIKSLAKAFENAGSNFKLIFRRHPRDNITYEEYEKIFNDSGIKLISTHEFDTDSIGAASDLIVSSGSIEVLNAIYRRKPALNIIDKELDEFTTRIMPPAVKMGATVGITKVSELSQLLPQLLDAESDISIELRKNMKKYYNKDGKNAERVAEVVREIIKSK